MLQLYFLAVVSCVVLCSKAEVYVHSESESAIGSKAVNGSTLPPHPIEKQFEIKRLPIEFLVDDQAAALRDSDTHWFCVKIRLLPEDGGDKYAVLAKRLVDAGAKRYRLRLSPEEASDGSTLYEMELERSEQMASSPYRSARAKTFIEVEHANEDDVCRLRGGVYASFADIQGFVHDRMSKVTERDSTDDGYRNGEKDVLETHIDKWNRRWARPSRVRGQPNGCKTRKDCSGYHVSYVKVPSVLQQKLEQRLKDNFDAFYDTHEAGIAGTTGAHFVAGNRGFRFPNYGLEKLRLLFSDEADLREYEESIARVVRARKDVQEKFGGRPSIDFQHRLWRYGPDFPVRGGVWHRDTCPFGIGGSVPVGSWQLTSVFVPSAINLDLSQSGTRLKDRFGKTHDMPCVVGTANVIRTGENDPHSPWHAGPILRKLNKSAPAYRIMVQTKLVISAATGDVPAGAEQWSALGMAELHRVSFEAERLALSEWFANFSQALAWGASESNAVGSEAYPVDAQKAWARTEEFAKFLGFQGGFLPHFAAPPVDAEDESEVLHAENDNEVLYV